MEDSSTYSTEELAPAEKNRPGSIKSVDVRDTAFGSPRDYMDNQFVYTVISARARGLAVGVNLCPEKDCNFHCIYCHVHRNGDPKAAMDVEVMASELKKTVMFVRSSHLRERPWYRTLPDELLQLRHVGVSGDGEPTLSPQFAEALEAIVHVRAVGGYPFKIVVMTNGSGLDQPKVQQGLRFLTKSDEVWTKLDGGTQAYINKVNRSGIPLDRVLSNILMLGRQRPVVIQSLFPAINNEEPPLQEIEQYAGRLLELKSAGANISLVQIYSATRPTPNSECGHLPLKTLSRIAHVVRKMTGLKAEVF